jgi:Zn-dependent peptidase ImmA (M78 family)
MSDKKALLLLSEILQKIDEVREIAQGVSNEAIRFRVEYGNLSDEEREAQGLNDKQKQELETNSERDAASELLRGCAEIEEKARELIKICIDSLPAI